MKSQLNLLKEQKNIHKKHEKNLIKKLDIKEKEVNELKTIFNTNVSLKSQISSIYQELKDDEYSKEILPYNEKINLNKKNSIPKSLSLFEKKLTSHSSSNIHSRNIFQIKSNNSRNLSKKNNINKKKIEYKYKTIANVFSGSSSKLKNDKSVKVNYNLNKPNFYYNYNSVNSLRGWRLEKSDSRAILSRIGKSKSKIYLPEESISKNVFINTNKNNKNEINIIVSNRNKKMSESGQKNKSKNKILINYNTNIINTNVSIDKLTLKERIKEIRKVIDDKLNEITKNKKNKIRRTISAVYEKRSKSPFFNEKIKTKKDNPSFKYNNLYNNIYDDKSNSNSNKHDMKSNKKYKMNNYNSRTFKPKVESMTIQNKDNKKIRIKFKNKNNSMYNMKNTYNDNIYQKGNKKYLIQAYTGEKSCGTIQLYKKRDKNAKMKKNTSVINFNNKTAVAVSKFQNWQTNNKTIRNNLNYGLTYRKNGNYDKISLCNEKLYKNNIKLKKKNLDINNSNIRINTSLRKLIITKSISNSNVA